MCFLIYELPENESEMWKMNEIFKVWNTVIIKLIKIDYLPLYSQIPVKTKQKVI